MKTESNTDAGSGCPSATCSQLSDTPETDAFLKTLHPAVRYPIYEAELRRLERQRNEARNLAFQMRDAFYTPASGWPRCDPFPWESPEND